MAAVLPRLGNIDTHLFDVLFVGYLPLILSESQRVTRATAIFMIYVLMEHPPNLEVPAWSVYTIGVARYFIT